jgi:hypothetical protein
MKLHGLRTSFGHQLKLEYASLNDMEKGVLKTSEENGPFISKWQWYNQLSFLRDTMTFRSTTNCSALSPSSESPPPDGHSLGHLTNQQLAHQHQTHHEDQAELIKSETPSNLPIDVRLDKNSLLV